MDFFHYYPAEEEWKLVQDDSGAGVEWDILVSIQLQYSMGVIVTRSRRVYERKQ